MSTKHEAQSSDSPKKCGGCGMFGAKLKCQQCQQVHYCGRGCQTRSWKSGHKHLCKILAKAPEESKRLDSKFKANELEAQQVNEANPNATCYICLGGVEEGELFNNCACRGENAGVHLKCVVGLAESHYQSTENDCASDRQLRYVICPTCLTAYTGQMEIKLSAHLMSTTPTMNTFERCTAVWTYLRSITRAEGNWYKAILLCNKELIALINTEHAGSHFEVAFTMFLANALRPLHHVKESIFFHKKNLLLAMRVHGPDHDTSLMIRNNLSNCFKDQGNFDEAVVMARSVLKAKVKLFGALDPRSLATMISLAQNLIGQGNITEGRELLERGVNGMEKTYGAHHAETFKCKLILMENLDDDKKLTVLRELYASTSKGMMEPGMRDMLIVNFTNLLMGQGHLDEARKILRSEFYLLSCTRGKKNLHTKKVGMLLYQALTVAMGTDGKLKSMTTDVSSLSPAEFNLVEEGMFVMQSIEKRTRDKAYYNDRDNTNNNNNNADDDDIDNDDNDEDDNDSDNNDEADDAADNEDDSSEYATTDDDAEDLAPEEAVNVRVARERSLHVAAATINNICQNEDLPVPTREKPHRPLFEIVRLIVNEYGDVTRTPESRYVVQCSRHGVLKMDGTPPPFRMVNGVNRIVRSWQNRVDLATKLLIKEAREDQYELVFDDE
eukprot:m.78641 g.78641  ORF g.78641 m.78641 type:complete len:669 (-) comp25135_c0_seq1:39-2045(-)